MDCSTSEIMRRLLMSEQTFVLGYQHFMYIICYVYWITTLWNAVGHTATVDVRTTISGQDISIRHDNTLRPRQHGRHFADDIFTCIFLNKNVWISIRISLKFVPKGPINNIPALVQIMAWRRPGDKSLSEAMMVNLPTHICVTRPQWVNLISAR